MVKRNRFTRLIAAMFLATLVLSAFAPLAADVNDPGGGTNPVDPGDSSITGTMSTYPGGTDMNADWYTVAYLLMAVL